MSGKVFFVGAGPGAADLITVRGARLLAQAQVILHDALASHEMLALAPNAQHIPVGKRAGKASAKQADINRAIIVAAEQHSIVVRLKGGDPVMFGRLDEEIQTLKLASIDFEVVPGITSASAAAASLAQSLTTRNRARSVIFTTPRVQEAGGAFDAQALGTPEASVAVYMGGTQAAAIAQAWLSQGISPDVAVSIAKAVSTPEEQLTHTTVGVLALGSLLRDSRPVLLIREASSVELSTATLPERKEPKHV